ncbi:hypothetical protein ACIHCQ_25065 [Streptomyces sp. NPDC052236]|uniref:hypothetical protein n=1 Tax=Streptomyces sp. NPDC052236 TaxID=3365686 RepID=UPI0037D4A5DA
MRSGLIALRAAGAAVVLGVVSSVAAPAAYADDSVRATVGPSRSVPGGDVEIRVSGCKGTTGTVRSRAFVVNAELAGSGRSLLSGNTMVKSSARSGTYEVHVACDGSDHPRAGSVQVGARHLPTHPPKHPATGVPAPPPTSRPTHHQTPVAPVRAGGGGAAPLAAGDVRTEDAGPGTPHTIIGLVLAGIAAVAVALRTSRRRRRTDTD